MTDAELAIEHARAARKQGDTAAAETNYLEAAALAGAEGLPDLRAHALRHVAELAAERGAGERALEAAQEALAIYRSTPVGPPLNLANAHRVRALAFASLGRADEAARDWQSARALYEELGIEAAVIECNRRLNSA